MHITIRLAWHNDGWNGHICNDPKKNTYCVGRHSYPGDKIKESRDLEWESRHDVKGRPCDELYEAIPACGLSINAFGDVYTKAKVDVPEWYNKETQPSIIDIPPSTVCIWPYEGMYSEDVVLQPGEKQKYDYPTRLKNAKDYFGRLEKDKDLIIYYANYSNPFSEDEASKYVIVGISRLKEVGKVRYYEGTSDEIKRKYANGFVWQLPITSHYPDQGFVIPYHKYKDDPEVLKNILFSPDQQRDYKYATREISNDNTLALIERFIEIVNYLIEINDDTQNWIERRDWLLSVFSELWIKRGAYPGLTEVLDLIDFKEGIDYYRKSVSISKDKEAYSTISNFLQGEIDNIDGLGFSSKRISEVQRNWKLKNDEEKDFLLNYIVRFHIKKKQIQNILSQNRTANNITASIKEIIQNPYLLCEQYIGDDIDDIIPFHTIDHGVIPKPDLGIEPLFTKNSSERFRALCIDVLKREQTHSFMSMTKVLYHINNKLSYLPEWKTENFTPNYFDVDQDFISKAIEIQSHNDEKYLYLKEIFQDENTIQKTIKELCEREDIALRIEINEESFQKLLLDKNSDLNKKSPEEYMEAIKGQSKVAQQIFTKPFSIISGAAGTGKTTILKSIISNIERTDSLTSGIVLLSPTGKATERIKEKTGKSASTIHSFLAGKGWLNDNFTFKRFGGEKSDNLNTLIIDECSMIDLSLFATLFRCINWNSIKRLILVGDPNQLPPIGRGAVFSEIINWLKDQYPNNLGMLEINIRQLENKISKKGTGILDLANLYIQDKQSNDNFDKSKQEIMLKKVQQGGIIDQDLSVFYWEDKEDLEANLKKIIIEDLEKDTGEKANEDRIYELWTKAISMGNTHKDPTYLQCLSPFRGEFYGTDYLNILLQEFFNSYQSSKHQLDGVSLFDKVIQFRNRPKSNQISAYSFSERKNIKLDIYNGEIGFVKPHPFDKNNWKSSRFALKNFQVKFERRDNYCVNYGYRESYGQKMFYEPVEENIELGYIISVHKAQGSEFNRVYLILPQKHSSLLSMELLYTAITRAQKHLTIFAQKDITVFHNMSKIEKSGIRRINSSIFSFDPLPDDLFSVKEGKWYEDSKIIETLSQYFVRSKSEMNIANILSLKNIPFEYEKPLFAPNGSMFLPDFTILWHGEEYYWEHLGLLDKEEYKNHWENKKKWYQENFPRKLITTIEGPDQTTQIKKILFDKFRIEIKED